MRRGSIWAFLALLILSVGCNDSRPEAGEESATAQTAQGSSLFRAPAIPNVVDGVVWEAGNWEPHLAAGEEGVSWGNHRAVVEMAGIQDGGSVEGGAADTARQDPDAVLVTIPWRRRDSTPDAKAVTVVDATTGVAVKNVLVLRIENVSGDVVFQPTPGSRVYHVYYMPWQSSGGYYPTIAYPTPAELRTAGQGSGQEATAEASSPSRAQEAGSTSFSWEGLAPDPDPGWEAAVREADSAGLPRAEVTRIQSVDEFHSFFPMEVIATPEEEEKFWEGAGGVESRSAGVPAEGASLIGESLESAARTGWALVPEHRDYPIRMRHFIPKHWADRAAASLMPPDSGVSAETFSSFSSQALRDESFAFQLGVVSGNGPLEDLQVTFQGFPDSWMETLTCFNCEGIDEKGAHFTKDIDIPPGTVQPLWIGMRIPHDQPPGPVEGTVSVTSGNAGSKQVAVSLDVQAATAVNGGFNQPELQTRLLWFNSTVGTDPDFIIDPFVPIRVRKSSAGGGYSLSILGRRVDLGPNGLPEQIFSYFTPELTRFAEDPEPILARPMDLRVITPGNHFEEFQSSPFQAVQEARGRVEWTAESTSDYLDMRVDGALEYDGMLNLRITLVATSDAAIDDVGLPVTLVPDAARYMLGLGRKGGRRPPFVDWRWAVENHQEGVWLGGVHKGLQYVLRDENYVRPLNTNFYRNQPLNMPPSWFNEGRGGIQIFEERLAIHPTPPPDAPTQVSPDAPASEIPVVTADNYSGPRQVMEGDTLHFNIRFLITPFKPIDTETHFDTRFVHQYVPVDSVRAWGGTVVNIHHANEINPYINYPFFNLEEQGAYIEEAHGKGIKVKLYNTIRELTYKAHELFAMRSFGDEILNDGEGGGHSWMQEHLESNYHSAWHAWRVDDAAMLNKGTSRWTNYYIEGLNWLAENQHIDGLYLDDIAFSRETVKRLVAVLHEHRDEVVIDLHSANQFNVRDGFTNSAMLYMEHFPFISRLWFGEYFEYDLDEGYWMTEVSGLPFGLMGEMLQDGGHPYRGLLYGMTGRKYGGNDPRPVWALMNDFGIAGSRMKGYWLEDAPVTADHPRILATTYLRPDAALAVLASWSEEDEVVRLDVDWDALGLEPLPDSTDSVFQAFSPSVEGLQSEAELDLSAVPVPAGQGLYLILRRSEESQGPQRGGASTKDTPPRKR